MAQPLGLDIFFRQDEARPVEAPRRAPASSSSVGGAPLDDTLVSRIADTEGLSPTQRRVMTALLQQESGNGRNTKTSVDGAMGAGQIIPDTFRRYAKPGEQIGNTEHNLAVMARIVKDLGNKTGDNPAKMATGYFSGEGNIGRDAPWKADHADGNGKRVSSYVNDVIGRLAGIPEAKAATPTAAQQKPASAPDLDKIPNWADIAKDPDFQALSPQERAEFKSSYFDNYIAPHAGAEAASMRQQFLAQRDGPPANAKSNFFTDLGNLTLLGIDNMALNARELAGKIPLVGGAIVSAADAVDRAVQGKGSEQVLKGNIEASQAALTDEMQATGQRKWWNQEKGTFGSAWGDPRSYISGIVQSLPETALTMIPAMRLAKAAYASKIAAGATAEVAAAAAARTATIAGGVSEGAMAGAGSSREVRDKIMAMKPEQLAESEAMRALMADGMNFESARSQLANDAAAQAFITSGVATGLFGGMGDRMLANAITKGIGKNLIGRAGKGAVGEGVLEEFPQETLSAVAENAALRRADPSIAFSDDALNRGLGGLATGGVQGGIMAGVFGKNESSAPPPQAPTVPTPDGRLEPQIPPAVQPPTGAADPAAGTPPINPPSAPSSVAAAPPPPPNPIQQSVDSIVGELAQRAGVPVETVLPASNAPQQFADADVLEFAQTRLDALMQKREGGSRSVIGQDGEAVDMPVPGVPLSQAEQDELALLELAGNDAQSLREFYGFANQGDQSEALRQNQATGPASGPGAVGPDGLAGGPAAQSQPAAGAGSAQGGAEGGGQRQGVQPETPVDDPYGFSGAFGSLANGGTTENLLKQAFDALQAGKDTIAGIKDPILQRARPAFEAGLITSPQDIARFEREGYPAAETEGEREARLEREAMQAPPVEEVPVEDDLPLPPLTQPTQTPKTEKEAKELRDGTQAPEAQQAEAQGPQAQPGAVQPVTPPRTEKEAREQRAQQLNTSAGPVQNPAENEQVTNAAQREQVAGEAPPAQGTQAGGAPAGTETAQAGAPAAGESGVAPAYTRRVFRGSGRKDKGSVYNGGSTPILGDAAYYALDEKTASKFGPNVETRDVSLRNPLVIDSDEKWRALTREAGWQLPNPQGRSDEETKRAVDALQKIVRDRGHDGVVIDFDPTYQRDILPDGRGVKTLRNVFGDPQVVVFDQPQEAAKPKTEKEAREQRANQEETNAGTAGEVASTDVRDGGDQPAGDARDPRGDREGAGGDVGAPANASAPSGGSDRTVSGAQSESDGALSKPKTEREAKEKRKPETSQNVIFTEEAAAEAREFLKRALNGSQLNSGIDPKVMQAGIMLAGYHIEKGARTFAAYSKAMIADLGETVRPYLKSWYMGVKYDPRAAGFDGMDSAAEVEAADVNGDFAEPRVEETATEKPSLRKAEGRAAVARELADILIGGDGFATIVEARRKIEEITGERVVPGTQAAKYADEAIELAVVMAAREMIAAGIKAGRSDKQIFDRLLGLYERQPNLAVRDSTSIRNQAYSTPIPLAWVAMVATGRKGNVFEPTAGNGALVADTAPGMVSVNEINVDRVAALETQGFMPSSFDASEHDFPEKFVERVRANPPFGRIDGRTWKVGELQTAEIDHAISLNALASMKDDGRAVLIIGGPVAESEDARRQTYRGKAKREFFFNLYRDYNVVDHYTVDGALYAKQGASFPVDVIVINGRGKSSRALPAADLPALIKSWDELRGKLDENYDVGAERDGDARSDQGEAGAGARPGDVLEPAAQPNAGTGGSRGGRGSGAGVGSADGGGADVRAAGPGERRGDDRGESQRAGGDAGEGDSRAAAVDAGQGQPDRGERVLRDQPAGLGDGTRTRADRQDVDTTRLQVKYQSFSENKSVNTLVATNHLTAIERAFENLRERVGDIDEFVRGELQYTPEGFQKAFSAEQVEALALAIDNIKRGKGFVIGDQTGIGKGRVVAAMIRYAKLNGKTPVFATQMPDLYGDMMRDLNDIGMGNIRPLMTNNNASVPLNAEALAWFSEKQDIQAQMAELQTEIDRLATEELGDKLNGKTADERKKLIADLGKTSQNSEIRSLREEIQELRASIPPRRGEFLDTPPIEEHEAALRAMVEQNSIGDNDVIFTTYNQMAPLDSGKPRRDPVTGKKIQNPPKFGYRNTFLNHFVNENAMLILDESHNAGAAGDGKAPKLGDIVRGLIANAGGVFYSSATFAKEPKVMDAYSKTDLGRAFDTPQELMQTINSVPMQQVSSAMLVEAGQYLRRERSFEGIEYAINNVEVETQSSEDVSAAMRLVVEFDRAKRAAIQNMQADLDLEGQIASDGNSATARVEATNFTSVMHNVVGTFLLALKSRQAADEAIAAIRRGEKPVLTVANTMESFITDYAAQVGIGIGDKLNATFADVLGRYLEKTRTVRIKYPDDSERKHYLTDEQLGEEGLAAYEAARSFIDELDLDVPLSPIDAIKQRIEAAGFSIGEITGRQTVVDENNVLRPRNKAEMKTAGKKNTIAKFNEGQLDALIINRSGSTGLSMHASEKFADQRRRVMIIAQAELDINNHMQMLGRVNRTGQVTENGTAPGNVPAVYGLPRYVQLTANVPIELRPAAVLSAKMANLNANTTAGRGSAVEDRNAPDFMNKYGDQVAAELVGNNPTLNAKLGSPVTMDEDGTPKKEGAMAKVTGRVGLLPLKEQSDLYDQLIAEYTELVAQHDALGTNDLEAKTYPLDAETVKSTVAIPADEDSSSPFTAEVRAETVNIKKLGKPYPTAKVRELVAAGLGGKDAATLRRETVEAVRKAIAEEIEQVKSGETEEDQKKADLHRQFLRTALARFSRDLPEIGRGYILKTDNGNVYGVVTSIERKGKSKSPAALGAWKVKFAVVDGARSMTFSLMQLNTSAEEAGAGVAVLERTDDMLVVNAERNGFDRVPILEAFDRGQTDARENRVMITGNILRGAEFKGRLINYTNKQGDILQGILMPPGFDLTRALNKRKPVFRDPAKILAHLDKGGTLVDQQTGGKTVKIYWKGRGLRADVSKGGVGKKIAKHDSAPYFVSAGAKLRSEFGGGTDSPGLRRLIELLRSDFSTEVALVEPSNTDEEYEDIARPDPLGAAQTEDGASPHFSYKPPESVRVNARQKLEALEAKLEDGKITIAEYRLGVQQVIGKLESRAEAAADRRVVAGRRRGADWIIAQLRRGVADNKVLRGEAEFAEWLLAQNPELANDLGIGITSKMKGASGTYNPVARLMKLASGDTNGDTAVHEILHHTERMMPQEVQDGVIRAWQRDWDAAFKAGDERMQKALRDMLAASLGDKEAHERVRDLFYDGTLDYDAHYQLYSPSEYWAVNATRILSGRHQASGSWVKRAINWFKEFVQRLKGVLGLRSDAPILKALDAVLAGNGEFQSRAMLSRNDISGWLMEKEVEDSRNGTTVEYNDIVRNTQRRVVEMFSRGEPSLKTFNAYDRTLSTQYNKALKDKDYGRVFALANAMQNEVSLTSIRPAELAPGILPKVADIKSAFRTMVKGREGDKDIQTAAGAIFAGTLAGDNVLEGKVWSEDEFMQRPGATEAAWGLYQQARAAIDASLDELAAAEAWAVAQGFVPKAARRAIIDNPQQANQILFGQIGRKMRMLQASIVAARDSGNETQAQSLEAALAEYQDTADRMAKIFAMARDLKNAGYAPLMRFGKYNVTVYAIDPVTGNIQRDDRGDAVTLFFGKYETEAEAQEKRREMEMQFFGEDVRVTAGPDNDIKHELYAGISPETLALFGEALGAEEVTRTFYKQALSERSAMKRRLERKGIEGYNTDLPRVLSSFITSNGRQASQRYYLRDLTNAIKHVPKEKGDVQKEAQKLKTFVMNPNDPAAPLSSVMFAWFLGGSAAAAVVNLSQPVMMTAPYLSQFGIKEAASAMKTALPIALGKKQIDPANIKLREGLKRASREGIVEAQEIFHLYSIGSQNVASGLVSTLARIPGIGGKVKAGSADMRARANAFLTLWGSMFAVAESFNRKLTFIAAWEVAVATRQPDPYAFAVRAVNETQGIYNKVNRPNWARGPVGRTVLTFKQYSLMYIELLTRMVKRGGPQGKRAAAMMLAVLILASGEEGLPFAQDLDDIIDTVGQFFFDDDTNMRRDKRRWARKILGETLGDLFLYGVSSKLPLDFSGRLGLGNMIPGTAALKPSNEQGRGREAIEAVGPAAGLFGQVLDAIDAGFEGNSGKSAQNLAPKAVRDLAAAVEMGAKGYATDTRGRKVVDVTLADAALKGVGFNPTKVARETRKTGPVQQDIALQKRVEAAIVDQWTSGLVDGDDAKIQAAITRRDNWNRDNPNTPIAIGPQQIRSKVRSKRSEKDDRLLKSAPREMRGRIAAELGDE